MKEQQKELLQHKMLEVGCRPDEINTILPWLESVLAEEKIEPKQQQAWDNIMLTLGLLWAVVVLLVMALSILAPILGVWPHAR